MNDETAKAFEKFKDNWDPKDEYAKQAKKDEERGVRSLEMLDSALKESTKNTTAVIGFLQTQVHELRMAAHDITNDRQAIVSSNNELIAHNNEMMVWWEKQNELINKQMIMMATMGFELDLD